MSEYESPKLTLNLSLFRLPMLWCLIAAITAQLFIALNNPTATVAATVSAPVRAQAPQVFAFSQGPAVAPIKVELPTPQTIKQQISTKPSSPKKAIKTRAPVPLSGSSKSVEAVIEFAMNQRGKPYVWGATGPNSYDCSGLVMTAFSRIGIKLPRTTKTMVGAGYAVSKATMQRGDIVFPERGHVGIYLGDGMMIHSPQPGEVVKVSKVYNFYTARRLV